MRTYDFATANGADPVHVSVYCVETERTVAVLYVGAETPLATCETLAEGLVRALTQRELEAFHIPDLDRLSCSEVRQLAERLKLDRGSENDV